MSNLLPRSIALLALTSGLLLSNCAKNESGDETGPILRFSAIPDSQTTAQAARYQPVADYLAESLGIPVEFVPANDYGASVEKFENSDIQLAWFGGVTGVQARTAVDGARAIIAGEKDLQFKSYFIATASTGLKPAEEFPIGIASFTFTYGSPSSTSGCVMPTHFLMKATGKTPKEFFGNTQFAFSGAHDKTAQQVQDGTFQTGVLNYSTYDAMVEDGRIDPSRCVKIWETPTYADYNFTAHPDLEVMFGAGFIDRIQACLSDCKDPKVLKALDREQLVKVDNETFAGIASVVSSVKFE